MDDMTDEKWTVVWCTDSWKLVADRVRAKLPAWAEFRMVDGARPLSHQVSDAQVLIPTTGMVSAEVIAAAPHLHLITQCATAYNNIAVQAARERGIPVCTAPGMNAQSVAEQALMMMLMLARRAPAQQAAFASRLVGQPAGMQLQGKVLGIVGLGSIGKRLARAAEGLGMQVKGVTSTSSRADLEHLLKCSHIVSLHCPVTEHTRGLIGHNELLMMRPGAMLLNLARGEVVDKQALLQALSSGHLGAVGLDVHWEEPADPNDPLYQHPNVLAMPHAGVASEEVYDAYAQLLVDNITACREGRALKHQLHL